jgi:hypothetical protein
MPKATIDEDAKPLGPKYEIRVPDKLLVSSPPCNAKRPKKGNEPKLCRAIASRPDEPHQLGTLLGRDKIGHGSN